MVAGRGVLLYNHKRFEYNRLQRQRQWSNGYNNSNLGQLPVLETTGTELGGLAVSSDGKYVFVMEQSSTDTHIWRYDLTQDPTTGTWVEFANPFTRSSSGGNADPRGLTVDESGHLFAALGASSPNWKTRGSIICYDQETKKEIWRINGYDANINQEIIPRSPCYNYADNYLYWVDFNKNLFRIRADGDISTLQKAAGYMPNQPGYPNAMGFVNGVFYVTSCSVSGDNTKICSALTWGHGEGAQNLPVLKWTKSIESKLSGDLAWALSLSPEYISPSAQWKMLDGVCQTEAANSIAQGEYDLELRKGARTGALGASMTYGIQAGAIKFCTDTSYAYFNNSAAMIPATGDFALSIAFMDASASGSGRRLFSNAADGSTAAGSLEILTGINGNTLTLRYVGSDSTEYTIEGETQYTGVQEVGDDCEWHIAGIRREGASIELYLDGVKQGAVEIGASASIGTAYDYHIGCTGDESTDNCFGIGALIGEIRLFNKTVYSAAFATINTRLMYVGTKYPEDPAEPTGAAALPAAYGKEVAHTFISEGQFAAPAIYIASDGKYYLTVQSNDKPNTSGVTDAMATKVYVSTDKGANWSLLTTTIGGQEVASTIALQGVTLFEQNDKLMAYGQYKANQFEIQSLGSGNMWSTEAYFEADEGTAYQMSQGGAVAVVGEHITKSAVKDASQFSAAFKLAFVTFHNNDGKIEDGGMCEYSKTPVRTTTDNTYKNVLAGHAFWNGSIVQILSPYVQAQNPSIPGLGLAPASVYTWTMKYTWEPEKNPYGSGDNYHNQTILRTGNGMFGMVKDATSGRFYALSAEDGNKFVLLASENIPGWMPCGEIEIPSGASVYEPSIAIDGDDLVIAYGVRYDDGFGGATIDDGYSYIAVKTISDFRTAYTPEAMMKNSMRIAYTGGDDNYSLSQIWKASDGKWYQGEYLRREYDTIYTGVYSMAIFGVSYFGGKYYACQTGDTHLYELNLNGQPLNQRLTMDAPKSGGNWWSTLHHDKNCNHFYLTCGDSWLGKYDFSTSTWTHLVDYTDSTWDNPIACAVASDGTLYSTAYSANSPYYYAVRKFTANGEGGFDMTELKSYSGGTLSWSSFGGCAISDDDKTLYFAQCNGTIRKLDLDTNTDSVLMQLPGNGGNRIRGMQYFNGKLYANGGYGSMARIYEIDPETCEYTVLGCDTTITSLAPVQLISRGLMIELR